MCYMYSCCLFVEFIKASHEALESLGSVKKSRALASLQTVTRGLFPLSQFCHLLSRHLTVVLTHYLVLSILLYTLLLPSNSISTSKAQECFSVPGLQDIITDFYYILNYNGLSWASAHSTRDTFSVAFKLLVLSAHSINSALYLLSSVHSYLAP